MKIKNCSFTVLLSFSIVLFSINCQAIAATFTPKGAIQGKGIDFLLNVAANVFTDILKGALNLPGLTQDTSLAEADFTDRGINTAYVLIALADDAQDKKAFFGSGKGSVNPEQTVFAKSTQWPGTTAKIGALIDRGLFFETISLGSPPKTSLNLTLQDFVPSPLSENRTTSSSFGFIFANGNFIFGGQEKSRQIPIDPKIVPEPTSTLGFLALGTLGAASTLKRKLKPSKSAEKETTKVG
jgi:hypothetical protein